MPKQNKHYFAIYHIETKDELKKPREVWNEITKYEGVHRIPVKFLKKDNNEWIVDKKLLKNEKNEEVSIDVVKSKKKDYLIETAIEIDKNFVFKAANENVLINNVKKKEENISFEAANKNDSINSTKETDDDVFYDVISEKDLIETAKEQNDSLLNKQIIKKYSIETAKEFDENEEKKIIKDLTNALEKEVDVIRDELKNNNLCKTNFFSVDKTEANEFNEGLIMQEEKNRICT